MNLADASKTEWLETNGTGAFAMGTAAGVNTRRYHALLVASLKPPVERYVLLSRVEEEMIVTQTTGTHRAEVTPVLDASALAAMQLLVRRLPVSQSLIAAAVMLARMTRPTEAEAPPVVREYVEWGAGPRASQYLVLGAKARAAMDGRPQADLDDVRSVAAAVLRHRVMTNFAAEAADRDSEDVVAELVQGETWHRVASARSR